jgi:hypothetical protein
MNLATGEENVLFFSSIQEFIQEEFTFLVQALGISDQRHCQTMASGHVCIIFTLISLIRV